MHWPETPSGQVTCFEVKILQGMISAVESCTTPRTLKTHS